MFIVKSSYYVAKKILRKEVGNQDVRRNVWRLIWAAQVIPKTKVLAWRMVQNILLTRTG